MELHEFLYLPGFRKPLRPTKMANHIKTSSDDNACDFSIFENTPPSSPNLLDSTPKPYDIQLENAEKYEVAAKNKRRVSNYTKPSVNRTPMKNCPAPNTNSQNPNKCVTAKENQQCSFKKIITSCIGFKEAIAPGREVKGIESDINVNCQNIKMYGSWKNSSAQQEKILKEVPAMSSANQKPSSERAVEISSINDLSWIGKQSKATEIGSVALNKINMESSILKASNLLYSSNSQTKINMESSTLETSIQLPRKNSESSTLKNVKKESSNSRHQSLTSQISKGERRPTSDVETIRLASKKASIGSTKSLPLTATSDKKLMPNISTHQSTAKSKENNEKSLKPPKNVPDTKKINALHTIYGNNQKKSVLSPLIEHHQTTKNISNEPPPSKGKQQKNNDTAHRQPSKWSILNFIDKSKSNKSNSSKSSTTKPSPVDSSQSSSKAESSSLIHPATGKGKKQKELQIKSKTQPPQELKAVKRKFERDEEKPSSSKKKCFHRTKSFSLKSELHIIEEVKLVSPTRLVFKKGKQQKTAEEHPAKTEAIPVSKKVSNENRATQFDEYFFDDDDCTIKSDEEFDRLFNKLVQFSSNFARQIAIESLQNSENQSKDQEDSRYSYSTEDRTKDRTTRDSKKKIVN